MGRTCSVGGGVVVSRIHAIHTMGRTCPLSMALYPNAVLHWTSSVFVFHSKKNTSSQGTIIVGL